MEYYAKKIKKIFLYILPCDIGVMLETAQK
jgi:hypothetical protein